MKNTNITKTNELATRDGSSSKLPLFKYILLALACSICLAGLLLITKRETICVADWITVIGSDAIFLLLCLMIASIPSVLYLKNRRMAQEKSGTLYEILTELASFASGFAVFLIGVLLATGIQKMRIGIDSFPSFAEQEISYSFFLEKEQYFIFYLLSAMQMAIVAGIISLLSAVIFKISHSAHVSLFLPVLLLKLEDILAETLFGLNSALYYNGSLYMLSFGTLRFQLSDNIHSVRLIMSFGTVLICLLFSYISRELNIANIKNNKLKNTVRGILLIVLIGITVFCVSNGTLQFTRDMNGKMSIFFVPHLFDNIHFLTFLMLTYFLVIPQRHISSKRYVLHTFAESSIKSLVTFLAASIVFVFIFIPNITFNNSWGNIIHTLSYDLPVDRYEFIATSSPIIERSYGPWEAMIKSLILFSLALILLTLFYDVTKKLINEIAAVIAVFIPILLLSSGDLFFRFPWLYYLSPLSWTRLSLTGDVNTEIIQYPSFEIKALLLIILIFVLTACLFVITKNKGIAINLGTKNKGISENK